MVGQYLLQTNEKCYSVLPGAETALGLEGLQPPGPPKNHGAPLEPPLNFLRRKDEEEGEEEERKREEEEISPPSTISRSATVCPSRLVRRYMSL